MHSTRGPRVVTWPEAERVLAGFPDDLADEGPAAGPASLVGLQIARERGWKAPAGSAGSSSDKQSGKQATADGAAPAAEQADTQRAETETKVSEDVGDKVTDRPAGSSDGEAHR